MNRKEDNELFYLELGALIVAIALGLYGGLYIFPMVALLGMMFLGITLGLAFFVMVLGTMRVLQIRRHYRLLKKIAEANP